MARYTGISPVLTAHRESDIANDAVLTGPALRDSLTLPRPVYVPPGSSQHSTSSVQLFIVGSCLACGLFG